MKKIIFTGLILTLAAGGAKASNEAVSFMSGYVFPENKPASVGEYVWLPDGETYAVLSADGRSIVSYDARTGNEKEVLLDVANTREAQIAYIEGFTLSADGRKIMVWNSSRSVYRRSFTASYYTFDLHSRILRPLSDKFGEQRSPVFSPDGRMVAFVADNNIYVRKLDYQTEVAVTTDGAVNEVINGVPDWTYEEEFNTVCSMTWSPDNLYLCYLKYNESDVKSYDMQRFGGACHPVEDAALYPQTWSYKYPEAGTANSVVTVHSYNVETRKNQELTLDDNRVEYIPRIVYGADAETLLVATLNRDQNHYEIYRVNPKSTVAKSVYSEDSKTWINPEAYEDLWVGEDGFVVNSWKSGFNQLYKYTFTGAFSGALTSSESDVKAYYGCDDRGNNYYQVCAPTPLDRTVCRVDRRGTVTVISEKSGTSSAVFSPGCRYALMTYSDSQTPPVYTLCDNSGKALRTVNDNAAYRAKVGGKVRPREFFQMEAGNVTLNGYVIKPEGFVEGRKYPVVMYQYSGPGSQSVLNLWEFDWMDAFSARGYVIVCVDGRGTGGRGRDFCDIVYRNLGFYETQDQVAAARYAASLPYADASRIGIFGWSYGGYEALMCATDESGVFGAAVAVAPVTDWRFYDTVYTERYMLTPQQNETGYRNSAPMQRAGKLGCPLLMMYGTADDNVHPANTLEFVSKLQLLGNFCDMFVFPNMNHSIYGCNARAVVYGRMLDWFNKNL